MNTCDINELKHFQSLSSKWWDEQGLFRLLHAMVPLRMAFLNERISLSFPAPLKRESISKKKGKILSETSFQPLKGLRILDVGCGGGLLCEPLARLGADVTGIDPVSENIIEAKRHATDSGLCESGVSLTYLPCSLEDLAADFPPCDVLIASEILEHVTDPQVFLQACSARLKQRGALFVSTLNKTLKSYLFGIIAAEYILRWAPPGTHSWEKFICPSTLSARLQDLGFSYQTFQGISLSPLTQQWHFSPSLAMNYFLWAMKEV